MTVTKKYVAGLVGIIKNEYPREFKEMQKSELLMKVEMWYKSLARYPKEVVDAAFQRVIETSTFPPSVAHIMNAVKDIQTALEPTDAERWEQLRQIGRKASNCSARFYYSYVEANGLTQGENAKREFAALWGATPQILKDYLGSENGLLAFARLSPDDLAFEKGRFFKTLPTLKERQEIQQTISPNVQRLLASDKPKELSG